jgi:hypothetical protein
MASLPQIGMPVPPLGRLAPRGEGAAARRAHLGWAKGGGEAGAETVPRRLEDGQGADPGRVLRAHRVESRPRSQGAPAIPRLRIGPGRLPRPRAYVPEVLEPCGWSGRCWTPPSGKRLAPFMAEVVGALERAGELHLDPEVRSNLLAASPATIDRPLAPERKRLQIKGQSATKPGRCCARRSRSGPSPSGRGPPGVPGNRSGRPRRRVLPDPDPGRRSHGLERGPALANKASEGAHEAMGQVSGVLPFPLLGVDSDNGSEFINNNLFAWCQEHRITFTRSGPWRNNDNCFVEEKNWVVVSRTAAYLRTTPPRRCEPWPSCTATRCPCELLPAPDEARGQDPDGGQGVASLRPAAHAPLARPGLTREHRLGQQALLQVFRGLNPAELKRQIAPMQG